MAVSDLRFLIFVGKEIFPGGQVPAEKNVVEKAHTFKRIQLLGPHYVRTLETWAQNLEANRQRAIEVTSQELYGPLHAVLDRMRRLLPPRRSPTSVSSHCRNSARGVTCGSSDRKKKKKKKKKKSFAQRMDAEFGETHRAADDVDAFTHQRSAVRYRPRPPSPRRLRCVLRSRAMSPCRDSGRRSLDRRPRRRGYGPAEPSIATE